MLSGAGGIRVCGASSVCPEEDPVGLYYFTIVPSDHSRFFFLKQRRTVLTST